jgi:hypothetical protein
MLKAHEPTFGWRAEVRARIERARASYASKTLAASVLASVLRKETLRKRNAEERFESSRDAFLEFHELDPKGPWGRKDWEEAVAGVVETKVDPRIGPPPVLFAALKFLVAVLPGVAEGVQAATEIFRTPPFAPEAAAAADATAAATDRGVDSIVDASASTGAAPSLRALASHARKHASRLWNDPEGVVRKLLTGVGEESLRERLLSLADPDAVWTLDFDETRKAKSEFLTRVYVRDGELESPLAGRLLKFCYAACAHNDAMEAKAARKAAKRKPSRKGSSSEV